MQRMFVKLDYVYRAYRYRVRVDPAELAFVSEMLQPGQVAADIGSHKGAYTYWMRRAVGPTGAVFAFEPQPKQAAYLRSAVSAMGYDNVAIVPAAVSDHCGQMCLNIPGGRGRTHEASLEHGDVDHKCDSHSAGSNGARSARSTTLCVDVTTLDDFFAQHEPKPHLLKIDVEGHELAVLRGAHQLLADHQPAILIECEARHRPDHDVRPVFKFLESVGYTGSFFLGRTRRPLSEFNPAVHQHIDETGPGQLRRDYVNNFAFVAE
jgi:FkbM family methyltransferase